MNNMAKPIDGKVVGAQLLAVIDRAMSALKAIGLTHADACRFLGMHAVFQAGEDLDPLETIRRFANEHYDAYSTSEGETLQRGSMPIATGRTIPTGASSSPESGVSASGRVTWHGSRYAGFAIRSAASRWLGTSTIFGAPSVTAHCSATLTTSKACVSSITARNRHGNERTHATARTGRLSSGARQTAGRTCWRRGGPSNFPTSPMPSRGAPALFINRHNFSFGTVSIVTV